MTAFTLAEIAQVIGGRVDGDRGRVIERVRSIESAGAAEIAVVYDSRYFVAIDESAAEAVVIPENCGAKRDNVIRVPDPRRAIAPLIALFNGSAAGATRAGISPWAFVAQSARIGEDVSVAPGACIGEHAEIGERVRIHSNAVIGERCVIGDDCVIHPAVTLYPGTSLGKRVVIHAGTVIGSDGFGFAPGEHGLERIPHAGIVEIEDDVEIGANCAIDRAMLEVTRVGVGTKIDNLVQIGHNASLGPGCVLVGQSGVAGSATLGAGVQLGGQSGISDHVRVGAGVRIGAKSGVHGDITKGEWMGSPALPREKAGRMLAFLPHLPEYRERVRVLESEVRELRKMIEELSAKS